MQRAECRGHDNPWGRLTEESCMATLVAEWILFEEATVVGFPHLTILTRM